MLHVPVTGTGTEHIVKVCYSQDRYAAIPASTRHDPSFWQDKLSHGETRRKKPTTLKSSWITNHSSHLEIQICTKGKH
jgi:hypothetical protein